MEAQNPQLGFSNMLSPYTLDRYFQDRSIASIEYYLNQTKALEESKALLLEEIRELEKIISEHEETAAAKLDRGGANPTRITR